MLYYHSSSSRSSSSSISSSISFIFQNCLVMDIFTIESKAICDPYRKLTTSHNQLFCFVFRIRFSLNYSKFAFLNDQLHVERRMQKQHTEWMSTILIRDDNKSDCGLIEISRVNLSSAHPLQLFAYVLFFFSTLLLLPLSLSLLRTHSLTHSLTPLLRCDPAVRPIHHPATLPRTELLFLWCVTSRKQIHFSGHQFIIPNGESHLSCGGQPHFSPSCRRACTRACQWCACTQARALQVWCVEYRGSWWIWDAGWATKWRSLKMDKTERREK